MWFIPGAKAFSQIGAPVSAGFDYRLTPQLAVVDLEARVSRDGCLEHGEAQRARRLGLVAVDGVRERDQADVIEPEVFAGIEGDAQMPAVDRIEGAAEDADHRGLPRLRISAGYGRHRGR